MFGAPPNHYNGQMKKEKSQLERFKEAARQLESDDDEKRFEERLKKLVKQKPKDDKKED
ncbi:hypothetical protein ROA7023_04703 [Roseisalinus antarcticus]|uniref:Uncharacterized protein n=2 Tax=Roseisalinus antarcticus TaxID=254357 RepID=A0A1Y5U6Y3_9RHOB|nr:hypothetical protein ROA7023_04703 [Roseisalinus antarcticus]